jgi:hypothetical protein
VTVHAFNIRWLDKDNLPDNARVKIRGGKIRSISPDESYDLWFAVVQEVERQTGGEVEDLDYEIL